MFADIKTTNAVRSGGILLPKVVSDPTFSTAWASATKAIKNARMAVILDTERVPITHIVDHNKRKGIWDDCVEAVRNGKVRTLTAYAITKEFMLELNPDY